MPENPRVPNPNQTVDDDLRDSGASGDVSRTQTPEIEPEQWAEDYAIEKLGKATPRAARDVVRDAFLAGYLIGVLKSSDPPPSKPRPPDPLQAIAPEVLRGFRAMLCALTTPQAEHPDVRAACAWLVANSGDACEDPSLLSLTRSQSAVLVRCFEIGAGELQRRVIRGAEDAHLTEMIDAFDAYFAVCRAKLGHDRVPIATWETYTMIKRRHALVITGAPNGPTR